MLKRGIYSVNKNYTAVRSTSLHGRHAAKRVCKYDLADEIEQNGIASALIDYD